MIEARHIRNLALIGFMGTGKTTTGRAVARQLHFDFVDTDELIEEQAGKPVRQIFAENGEEMFREMERKVVADLAGRERVVISTGGGLGANEANLASLKQHALVVCLWATAERIWQRVRHQDHRPLLQDPDPLLKLRTLLELRAPVYRQADVLVNTELRSAAEVAQHVLHEFYEVQKQILARERAHPKPSPGTGV